jgi:hypothetical protein
MEERIMKTLFAMATTGTLLLSGVASAQELPNYELSGLPISPHQISITGATANLKEQSAGTSLTMDWILNPRNSKPCLMCTIYGMPASPFQILVLAPRQRV